MSEQSSPGGLALVLVLFGLLLAFAGIGGASVTGNPAWRRVVLFGCTMQAVGWKLHGFRNRGVS
ncbi:hypothetical protein KQY30_18160 [Streptomyces sp. GMY02]|uniref:hypothetical protein n=1 Tax=Streptomyces sp. GMY02 TaxID=1333528 RepID=UPI001C2B9E57|nr:hypothetical protein [Streptomyces sp. GMY02]QXE35899.1 hypothetical protein KQY30_18160 [Streptomyces sp. GMY02]